MEKQAADGCHKHDPPDEDDGPDAAMVIQCCCYVPRAAAKPCRGKCRFGQTPPGVREFSENTTHPALMVREVRELFWPDLEQSCAA